MSLAAHEAIEAGYPEITPAHLLMALCRVADAEVSEAAPTVSMEIQREFEALGITPRRFRRRLRALLGHGGAQHQEGTIHRSPACRAVFTRAASIAAAEHVPCDIGHLVRAAFISLAEGAGPGQHEKATEAFVLPADDIPTEL